MRRNAALLILFCSLNLQAKAKNKSLENIDIKLYFDDFKIIGQIEDFKDFPKTPWTLKKCRLEKNVTCLKTFSYAEGAVKNVFKNGHEQARTITLSIIKSQCANINEICNGAAALLYFFRHSDDNKIFLAELQQLHSSQLIGLFVEKLLPYWAPFQVEYDDWADFVEQNYLEKSSKINIYFDPKKKPVQKSEDGRVFQSPSIELLFRK